MSPSELALYQRAKSRMGISAEEHHAEFTRYLTGFDGIFNDRNLYYGSDQNLMNRFGNNLEAAKVYLQGLETQATRIASAHGVLGSSISLLGQQGRDLNAFRDRKRLFFELSTAANEYAANIYGMQHQIESYVSEHRHRLGGAQNAFEEFMRSQGGKMAYRVIQKSANDLAGKGSAGGTLFSNGRVMVDPETGAPRVLMDNVLMTHFMATAYAATTLISKTFEVGFSMGIMDMDRARSINAIMDQARTAFGDQLPGGLTLGAMKGWLETRAAGGDARARGFQTDILRTERTHASLSGMLLTINQIAREAIKPRGGDTLQTIFDMVDNAKKSGASDYIASARSIATATVQGHRTCASDRGRSRSRGQQAKLHREVVRRRLWLLGYGPRRPDQHVRGLLRGSGPRPVRCGREPQ
jgi:hypothetical protein